MSFLLVQLECPYSHQQYINVILIMSHQLYKCPYSHQQYINVILISTTKMSLFTSTIYKCHSY